MAYLDKISSPNDIKKFTKDELEALSQEIREFLIDSVTKTGGHLASNLGVVELTVALLAVFDMPKDKVVWDVGHQSYVYKLLTGRKDGFKTLRKFGGMSGFPKTEESIYDSFNTGHSSTSASAVLGMARSRDLKGEDNNVIAVFGDGALTGGMMFEAMNDAGRSKTKVIYILNDNAMSISKNVGAVSKYLRELRQKPSYFKSKQDVQAILSKSKRGMKISLFLKKIKRAMKAMVLPTTLFEDLGFDYYGPIDGHDFSHLFKALEHAKVSKKSVLIHLHTKKGKGYPDAEKNPHLYHGISAGNKEKQKDFSSVLGDGLTHIAEENDRVVAVTAAMAIGTGLDKFRETFKTRYFDVGIAEQHAVTMSAGLAISGHIPVVPLYSSFLQRAYDQVLHDVCLQNLHVIFPIDRAGVVGADGETHQGMYDMSFLYSMPNMSVLSPSTYKELTEMLYYAVYHHNAPIAIRYPRGTEITEFETPDFKFGKGYTLKDGEDVAIFTMGRMIKTAMSVSEKLSKKGISAGVYVMPTVKPLDREFILDKKHGKKLLVTIEDGVIYGGFGSAVNMIAGDVLIKAYPDKAVTHGSIDELDKMFKMDAESISEEIEEKLNER
ncbi:MAG: 1-deoxy-D-xylulose-5-phosphate synthase [Clostridia bacterium]|nr:1-deoxy-D-xylulose-5-phosphate synthase [Clostridia bacterium]